METFLAIVVSVLTVAVGIIGFFVNRQMNQYDSAGERLRLAELTLARLEGLPKTIERDLNGLREDMNEVKATLKEWHDDLYRAKTSTSSAGHYAVRQPPSSPAPPRPRDPRRDR